MSYLEDLERRLGCKIAHPVGSKERPVIRPPAPELVAAVRKDPYFHPTTLCELCEKACGGCSWTEYGRFEPVDGWEAIRSDIPMWGDDTRVVESYMVLSCPEFEADENSKIYLPFDKDFARRSFRQRSKQRGVI